MFTSRSMNLFEWLLMSVPWVNIIVFISLMVFTKTAPKIKHLAFFILLFLWSFTLTWMTILALSIRAFNQA